MESTRCSAPVTSFPPVVKSVKLGNVMAEVVMEVAGVEIVSAITRGSAEALGLQPAIASRRSSRPPKCSSIKNEDLVRVGCDPRRDQVGVAQYESEDVTLAAGPRPQGMVHPGWEIVSLRNRTEPSHIAKFAPPGCWLPKALARGYS